MTAPTKTASKEASQAKYVPKVGNVDPFATRLAAELKHDRGILACRYDPAAEFLFAGARDYLVHRWDLNQEPVVDPPIDPKKKPKVRPIPAAPLSARTEYAGHESWVGALGLFSDGERMATGDFVGRLNIWSDRTGKPTSRHSFQAHQGSIRKLDVNPDGKTIATAGNDGAVRIWDAGAESKMLHELLGHNCHVYHVASHPSGKSLVSADLKGRVKHWSVKTGKLIRDLDASMLYTYSEKYQVDVGGIRGMTFNADGSQLCCAGATGEKGIAHSGHARVLLFDWETGKLSRELKPEKEEICTAWGVRFHPDGFIIGSGGSRTGGFLWFWTPDNDVAFHLIKFKQRAPGFDLDLSPGNRQLAVANHDGAIRLYEMPTKSES